jgi:dCTP deaminase
MILSDKDLKHRGHELISPFRIENVQPSSYDVTLYKQLAIPLPERRIDLRYDEPRESMVFHDFSEYVLTPGSAVLGCTEETIFCPLDLSARIEGKSSLGRLFLSVHITAGVLDAGFQGQVTLEIVNHGPWDLVLYPGMRIAQVSYIKLTSLVETPYGSSVLGSHYLAQRGPTPAAGKRL